MISQILFDETLLENQDVFEYSDEEALKETISEFLQQQSSTPDQALRSLEHLSLTHPSSPRGAKDRTIQKRFVECLVSKDVVAATAILKDVQALEDDRISRMRMLSLWFLMLSNSLWSTVVGEMDATEEATNFVPFIEFIEVLLPNTVIAVHTLARDLKRSMAPFWFQAREINRNASTNLWFRLLEDSLALENDNSLSVSLAQLARNLCNGSEDNKKSFVQNSLLVCQKNEKSGIELLVERLEITQDDDKDDSSLVREFCRLIAILNKFQPLAESNEAPISTPDNPALGGAPTVSSAHANVKEFHRAGAVPKLHRIACECLDSLNGGDGESKIPQAQDLLCDSLAALRTMAIDNDIVQNMIALGILDTVRDGMKVAGKVTENGLSSTLGLATATMGLVRNLCANDEVKTTICKSSLPSILQVMQEYLSDDKDEDGKAKRTKGHAILQEHACGVLAAMALRQPQNAHAIVDACGHVCIFDAMRAFPNKVTLQRQGCLAVRNIASRAARMNYDEDKTKLLDAGAEDILQNIAGRHSGSAEEAYAALRDLGCSPKMYTKDEFGNVVQSRTEEFGKVKSNFRAVYE